MNEMMNSMLAQIKELRAERAAQDRRRNILLGWLLAWLVTVPAAAAGWAGYAAATRPAPPPLAEVPAPDYPMAAPPSCVVIGEWMVRELNEDIDRVSDHRKLGTRHISIAPEGMRDYERVCLVNIEDPQGDVTQSAGCSDRFGNQAKGGGAVSLLDSAQMCLAVLRG